MTDQTDPQHDLFSLFELLQLMRSQPMYGYALTGLPKGELSDLTQHHYLVGMIAWRGSPKPLEARLASSGRWSWR